MISIHALVKRATFCFLTIFFKPRHFNPRPREEGDICFYAIKAAIKKFQSTPS